MPIVGNEEGPDFWDRVNGMADELGLEGEGRANYIDDHMIQGGYTRVQSRESYAKIATEGEQADQSPGSRWGFGAKKTSGTGGGGKTGAGADMSDRF